MTGKRPAWREPMVWLAAGIPLVTLVAGFATLRIASRTGAMDAAPEQVQRTAQTQTSDLSADEAAARMGLQARLDVSPQGDLLITGLGTGNSSDSLDLLLVHPTSAAKDIRLSLIRDGEAWRGSAHFDPAVEWRLQLHDPARQWRLVTRLPPQAREAHLLPALARP